MKNLMKLIEISDENTNGMMVVNKEGIVEYYWPGSRLSDAEIPGFLPGALGKRVVDLYPELTEETSTVMETLRTGKTIIGRKQTLTWEGYTITMMTTSYPILEDGRIEGAVDVARLLELKKNGAVEAAEEALYTTEDIITQNPRMEQLKKSIGQVAENDSPVMIYGETGTGKELVAQSLHSLSNRKGKPFFSQNCAAIPENLLESIFFGTEKGSFTGAESKKGIFEMADGGTLFLDEINSMTPSMQAKLLKALEEQRVRRIGGKQDLRFDVRIVCASNQDPERLVREGILRADLYYRISVVRLTIPPLRERPEDVLLLADFFIERYNRKMGKSIQGLNQMAKQLFTDWTWPGNVRELKNTIESAFNMEQSSTITLDSVQELLRKVSGSVSESGNLRTEPFSETKAGAVVEPQFIGASQAEGPIAPAWLSRAFADGESVDLKDILESCEAAVIREALRQETKLKDAARRLSISPQKLQYRLEHLRLRQKKK